MGKVLQHHQVFPVYFYILINHYHMAVNSIQWILSGSV